MPRPAWFAYLIFSFEKRTENSRADPPKSAAQLRRATRSAYNKLSDQEKERYQRLYEAEKARYEKEMKEFEAKGFFTMSSGAKSTEAKKPAALDAKKSPKGHSSAGKKAVKRTTKS